VSELRADRENIRALQPVTGKSGRLAVTGESRADPVLTRGLHHLGVHDTSLPDGGHPDGPG
jgi:hypothetical protein